MRRYPGSKRGERGDAEPAGVLARKTLLLPWWGGRTNYPAMKTSEIQQLKGLTTAEKLLLVEDLWQEIAAEVEAAPLAPHVIHALEESAARYAADPNEGSPWPDVRARVLARRPNG